MTEREDTLTEVIEWAESKRDGVILTPCMQARTDDKPWRAGYMVAMNEAAQHFAMERKKENGQ